MRLIVCFIFAVLFLSGCAGYRPLYGTSVDGRNVAATLSAVSITEQRTRTGQLLRNDLLSGFASSGTSQFELKLGITDIAGGVSATPGTVVIRKRYYLSVHYDLLELATGKILTSGKSFANVSYDTVREPIADLQAAENARVRATTEVSQDLRQRVAAYMATRKP
jgi:LPS-assembly lipoprotein